MASKELVFENDASRVKVQELLQHHEGVSELVLRNCENLTSQDVQVIVDYINPELEAFSVDNCQLFDDEALLKISEKCSKLTSISLTGMLCKLTSTGISSFVKNCTCLKHVTVISSESYDPSKELGNEGDIGNSSEREGQTDNEWVLDDEIFTSFLERTNFSLERLALCGFANISGSGLVQFLLNSASHIISLDLSELKAVNEDTLEVIGNTCSRLEAICLSHCNLTDAGIIKLCSKCKLLQSVNLTGCQDVTDDSIVAISENCTSLTHVKFGWCFKITERSLEALAKNCPNLVSVNASQCALKHIPFEFLSLLSLEELSVQGCTGLRCPPMKEATKGLEACRQFLEKCNLQSLCRLTFLGNQGSGKTSLMLSLPTTSPVVSDATTEGVHVATWRPFKSGKESVDLGTDVSEKLLSLTVEMWDCGGRSCLQGVLPLFLCEQSVYAIVFHINDPMSADYVSQWMLFVRSKAPCSPFVLVGTHADVSGDLSGISENILKSVNKADVSYRQEIQSEIEMLRELRQEKCVESRINRLECLLENLAKLPDQVFFVSSLKGRGITELQHAVTQTLMDSSSFPHLANDINSSIVYLYANILQLREDNAVLLPWSHYLQLASNAGIADCDVEQVTMLLECKGCILVFNIPSPYQDQGPSKTVCVNPGALLNCVAGILCETDPREYVPQFVKAGKVEMFWPTGAKPNEWTLRAAIGDIYSKGLIRESVVPLCFKIPRLLDEEELQKVVGLFRSLGFLVEGAPKGNYDVELVMSQYKSLSVFKRYYVPLMNKLPTEPEVPTLWPSPLPEGNIQVGWRYKFRDLVTVDYSTLFIGSCSNLKPSCEICAYWNAGAILRVGHVTVRMSRDGGTLDVIGRCKITNGSKQALNMTWFVLAKFFYVIETLMLNYKGVCPEVIVPIVGCNRPKHKPLYELISDYNSQLTHHTNYRWFIPPAALDADEHTEIPADCIDWLASIASKSVVYISYHGDQQHEVKVLQQFLDRAGFHCLGDWELTGVTGQELTEKRRRVIMGSSLFLAFVSPQYLDWQRAHLDVNTALSHNKPLISALFDKSTWSSDGHELGTLLGEHGAILDLSAGSGTALSHQYDQGQVDGLISFCNGILYGTGDIHPPEPPRTPDHETQVLNNANLDSSESGDLFAETASEKEKHSDHKASAESNVKIEDDKVTEKIKRMAASAVAAAVAGATAQQISKSNQSPSAIKAASAAAEVAQAVVDGNSEAAAQAVSKVAKIVENSKTNAAVTQNGSATRPPPKSSTCTLL